VDILEGGSHHIDPEVDNPAVGAVPCQVPEVDIPVEEGILAAGEEPCQDLVEGSHRIDLEVDNLVVGAAPCQDPAVDIPVDPEVDIPVEEGILAEVLQAFVASEKKKDKKKERG
jgi:hypothetical protein